MTTFPFKKRQIVVPFVFGSVFLAVGLWSMITRSQLYLSGFAGLGLFWVATGIFRKIRPYISIDTEIVKMSNDFFTKKMALADIILVNNFAGDLIVKSEKKEIYIYKDLIEPESIPQLEKILSEQLTK